MDTFLGEKISYWVELQKNIEKLGQGDLFKEVIELRGRISFYESRVKDMAKLMNQGND